MAGPRIEAIALVGSRNQRLFLASRVQSQAGTDSQPANDETLRLEYAAHCSLDIVEERREFLYEGERIHSSKSALPSAVQPRGAANEATVPSYLGLVLTLEDLAIYAMSTSTKLKILLLLRPGDGKVKDLDCLTVSSIFSSLRSITCDI